MHEFSIAERIVEAALGALARVDPAPTRLRKTRVVVGRLHQLVPDYLVHAYALLARGTPAAGSELEIVSVPVVARCRECAWQGDIEPPIFRCNACRALAVDVVAGRELYLEQIEVESEDDAAPHERLRPDEPA